MQLARASRASLPFALSVSLLFVAGAARADAEPSTTPPSGEARPPSEAPPSAPPAPAAAPPTPTAAPPAEAAAASSSNLTSRAALEVGGYLDSTATSVLTPSLSASVASPTSGWAASGRYLVDVVSAASPDIISTASPPFRENRHAGSLGFRYKPGNYGFAASAGTSYTPDYFSLNGGVQLTQDLDDKNLTLTEGYSYGKDTIGRTGTSFSTFHRTLQYHALTLGASRVVNSGLVIGIYGDVILERGDQSKPYRYIPIFSPDVAARVARGASVGSVVASRLQARPLEQLPLQRDRFAVTGKLAWRGTTTTLRVDERLYTDTWGQRASTTDARYFVDLGSRFTIWPHARFNIQNSVDFWKRAYSGTANDLPALRTGDRELSSLFTVGGGGGLRIALGGDGQVDDLVLTTTLDGFYTSFADAIYVKERFSALVATGLEVTF